jgi:hypothetical protein
MSTREISWGSKGSRCVGLTTLPHSCAEFLEILGSSTPPGALSASPGLYWDTFTFTVDLLLIAGAEWRPDPFVREIELFFE